MKRALITGVTGQDGSHLVDLLLAKGYQVHGIVRRSSTPNSERLEHVVDPDQGSALVLHEGDLGDAASLHRIVAGVGPDEVYNLAAQSHVDVSFKTPAYTLDVTGVGAARVLEAVRREAPNARFYQASSSEMFGSAPPTQDETTPFQPRSPYAVGKVMAHYATINYREAYGLFACSGILFNHEGERRGHTFVTQKIARAAAAISLGLQERLFLGNLDAKRDWGYAPDYVRAMWLMLQQESPDDYVIASGESHTVREFCVAAFDHLGLDWEKYITVDPTFYRPSEVDHLEGSAIKAEVQLGWKPEVTFADLVRRMVEAALAALSGDVSPHESLGHGRR